MKATDKLYHERKIKNAAGWFFVGCIAFMSLEITMIYLGTKTFTHPELDWPSSVVAIGLGGLYLLWQMTVAMFFKTPLPETYHPIVPGEYPEIWAIIDEITSRLNVPAPQEVYIAPGINVAVFCRPTMLSMLIKPKQELVIGEMLTDMLTSDELRVILYHEFGHYASGALGKKTPVYVISQFSKSFTSIKKIRKLGVWRNMINSQVDLFSYFAFWLCSIIDRHYRPLAQGEELSADDIAVENMNAEILAQTLVKVSLLQHYLRYLQWISRKYGIKIKDSELPVLLLCLCLNHKCGVRSISPAIRQRIERLTVVDVTNNHSCPENNNKFIGRNDILSALIDIHTRYEEYRVRSKSVKVTFHLDKRKHKLPWVEGKYQILLDGKSVGTGNFIKGFEFSVCTSPGKHTVSVYGITGIITVPYDFECRIGDYIYLDMDFKVHIRHGFYEIFVVSSKNITNE